MARLMKKIREFPVPLLPTMVGVLTLSNVYNGMGYTWVRHLSMWLVGLLWVLYLVKIVRFPGVVQKEYKQVTLSALYAGLTMTLMSLSSYIVQYAPTIGRSLWLIAVIVHIAHIIYFTMKHVAPNFQTENFLPSWFVTYTGLAVSVVIGKDMGFNTLQYWIAIYCIVIYLVLLPFIVKRLATRPIAKGAYHTQGIVVAPVSLSIVSYLNVATQPKPWLIYCLALLLVLSLAYYANLLLRFITFDFTPGYAGTTFPMAIGVVASGRVSGYLLEQDLDFWGHFFQQLQGLQLYITTIMVGYVFLRFMSDFFDVKGQLAKLYPDD